MQIIILISRLIVEAHGMGYMAKYFPNDTLYNSDAAIEVYCDLLKFGRFRIFIDYRDELYMGQQENKAISLDPRYAHYFLTPGVTFDWNDLILTGCIVHDCMHDIDIENPGTPVFNRFRLMIEPEEFHIRNRSQRELKKIGWRLMIGSYPQLPWIYAWTNWGADYKYEMQLDLLAPVFSTNRCRLGIGFSSNVIKREHRGFYQRHIIRSEFAFFGRYGLFSPFISYFIYSDDPLKNPGGMGIFGIEVVF
ncbi:MAG TPA: hypothetical protein EYP58_04355 [bacterium (Candidatus Stahlbacteria)]|nr:hypothetical protein [Candidatus Stahlbacteria bacterium]